MQLAAMPSHNESRSEEKEKQSMTDHVVAFFVRFSFSALMYNSYPTKKKNFI